MAIQVLLGTIGLAGLRVKNVRALGREKWRTFRVTRGVSVKVAGLA